MNAPLRIIIALLLATLFATSTPADELRIPLGSQNQAQAMHLPARGISMDRVRSQWGNPASEHAAVGQPPITRWDYPSFSVYFEYNHVVHAVVHHRHVDSTPLPTDS